jgi:hypothetical protein
LTARVEAATADMSEAQYEMRGYWAGQDDLPAARAASKAVADEALAGENRELHTEIERLTEENDRYGIELDLRRDEIHRLWNAHADLRAAGHIVYVTPTRIACVPECANPGKHLDEYRAVNRDNG